ncbi:TonB-dependent receptor [Desertivirga brevis]|uniref:TonB-dependent receptor n=1 Tax=Desertivirga brevis TaxID=2810310 RepID=UPI001F616B68|nr:TonB-dependent receptor [Pedobacter sp. SYSU D00873]
MNYFYPGHGMSGGQYTLIQKILLIMKMTIFLIVAFSFGVRASGYSQSVRLSAKSISLEEAISEISKQTNYRFFYDPQLLARATKLSVELHEDNAEAALKKLLRGQNLTYRIIAGTITIVERKRTDLEITGTVRDSTGVLPGASVFVEGVNGKAVVTDQNGRYRIRIPDNSTLVFRFIGYEDQKVKANGQTVIDVVMVPAASSLEEVIVVGYGSQKKKNVTGAISSVQADVITQSPVASVSSALAGRLPGLIAVQPNGMPGNDQSVLNIRGFGEPLVLVDGAEANLNSVDATEIESISVLKDASAAVYGSRAGNGVVLITTKRGKIGKPVITLNSSFTAQGVTAMPVAGNAGMYAQILREGHIQGGQPVATAPYTEEEVQKFFDGTDQQYPNTNWFDVLLRDWAPQQDQNLSVRGGSDKIKYYGFLGYLKQETVWKRSGASFERINLRSNIDATITRGLTSRLDFSTNLKNGKYPNRNMDINNTIWADLWNTRPVFPAEFPDPTKIPFAEGGGTGGAHITGNRELSGYSDYRNQDLRFVFDLNYDAPFAKGLSAKALVSYIQGYGSTKNFQKPVSFYKYDYAADIYTLAGTFGSTASLNMGRNSNRQILTQGFLTYDHTFAKKHDLGMQLIYEAIDYFNDDVQATRSNFLTPSIDEMLAGSTNGMTNSALTNEMGRKSYIGRLNYTFSNRYIFEASLRADASAKFPSSSRWGYFPGASFGWRIEQEPFMKRFSAVESLKLRLSYGSAGNDNTGNFQYMTGYSITDKNNGGTYIFGSTRYPGIVSRGLANPDLTWEKLDIYNVGTDVSLWKGALYGSFDAFYRERSGILANRLMTVPSSFGSTLPPENINKTNTRGFELLLGTSRKNRDFTWDVSANISWSRSKWQYYEEPVYTDADQQRQNQRTGNWTDRTFGYVSDGLFTSQEEISNLPYDQDQRKNTTLRPGDVKYLDTNSDGVIDWKDQVEIGKGTTPNWMAGFNAGFGFKGFDLSFLFQGAIGHYVRASLPQYSTAFFENRWTEATNNKNALIPRLGGASSNGWLSDYNLINGSYMRLKTLNVGYTIKGRFLNSIKVQRLRVYGAGANLLTFSKLNKYDLDPESPSGVGGMYYPQQRNLTVGLDLTL